MHPILSSSCASFDKYKQSEHGKERWERGPQDKMRKKDPTHIEAMWRQKKKRSERSHEG